jgi:hypothetical protein
MRVNWFSPLPPAPGAAARCTAQLLPHLRQRLEVVLWADQAKWDAELLGDTTVCRYHPEQIPWEVINRAELSVYHLGLDLPRDAGATTVSRHHPGLIVLHECERETDLASYRGMLEESGSVLGVLVHARPVYEALRQARRWPVAYHPPLEEQPEAAGYVAQLLEMMERSREFGAVAAGLRLSDRAAGVMGLWLSPHASDRMYRRVAATIDQLVA